MFTLTEKEPGIQAKYYSDPYDKEVDFVFLNTCGFISSARDEAAHTLEKLLEKRKSVYLLGCAVQYYKDINKTENPLFEGKKNVYTISRNDFENISLKKLLQGYNSTDYKDFEFTTSPRVYTNIDHKFEYLKIAE
ncbi:TPA: hypothetical protein DIC40_05325 [Patescibacteria group bacterium]|nr:hypothetical protein [Candidatus Gracilibacteria bacterium]